MDLIKKGTRKKNNQSIVVLVVIYIMRTMAKEIFIPGRVCLFGEHSDWAAVRHNNHHSSSSTSCVGMAIAVATNQGHHVRFQLISEKCNERRGNSVFRIVYSTCCFSNDDRISDNGSVLEFDNLAVGATDEVGDVSRESWMHALEQRFAFRQRENCLFKYVYGVMRQVVAHYQSTIEKRLLALERRLGSESEGYSVRHSFLLDNFKSNLPTAKGLSSSAAICVAITRCFNEAFELNMDVYAEIDMAYRSERSIGSSCGKLDQPCPAYGPAQPLLLTFRDEQRVDIEPLMKPQRLEHRSIHLIIVDLNASKDTVRILSDLNRAFDDNDDEMHARARKYLLEENVDIVHKAIQFIRDGNVERLGSLMTHAQERFDQCLAPLCPCELTAPLLHRVLKYEPIQSLIVGGKGHGSGGDGTALLLCRNEDDRSAAMEILEKDLAVKCLTLDL